MTKRTHVHWECKCQCVNLLIGYNIFSEICLWRVERQERLFWCSLTILRLLKVKAFIPAIAHSRGILRNVAFLRRIVTWGVVVVECRLEGCAVWAVEGGQGPEYGR